MATVNVTDAVVYPQDEGTDAPADYNQPESAGHVALYGRHAFLLDYVDSGLEFFVDSGANTLDITAGAAHVDVDGPVYVHDTEGEFSIPIDAGVGWPVSVPEVTGISLTSGSTNHVFLAVDPSQAGGEDDGVFYEVNTTDERPTVPYIKIGTAGTSSNDDYTHLNRGPWGQINYALANETPNDPDALTRREWVNNELNALDSEQDQALSDHTANSSAHHTRPSAGTNLTESNNAFAVVDNPTLGGLTVNGDVELGKITSPGVEGDAGEFETGGTTLRAVFNNEFRVRDAGNGADAFRITGSAVRAIYNVICNNDLTVNGVTDTTQIQNQHYKEDTVTNSVSGNHTVDLSNGNVHKLTLTGDVTLSFTGTGSTYTESVFLEISQDSTGGHTITWPTGVTWPHGDIPTLTSTAGATDCFSLTHVGGDWRGMPAGSDYS